MDGSNTSSASVADPKTRRSTFGLPANGMRRKRKNSSIDLDDYFVGPRDMSKHSRWPMFLRMHGSILPRMVLPIAFVGAWATLITCISEFVHSLGINSLLLTVTGFVVGLALSFRSSTAYERYAEGRKYWAQLVLTSHNLARMIWIHARERDGELGKQDLLAKITGLNLINAFAVALKHKLRFEPHVYYDDLAGLIEYLDTFAKEADARQAMKKKSAWKATGEYLGVPMAESNPRKLIKRSKKPLGNLPLEVLTYLAAYVDEVIENGNLKTPIYHTHAVNSIATLNDVLTGTERVLNTPLPIAYSIAISQITWAYVCSLPFQLYKSLGWVTIPGTILAAYIILGIALIGHELENPFGNDVNDLPLDAFCEQLAGELDIIASMPRPEMDSLVKREGNKVLYPLSSAGYGEWERRSREEIAEALRTKANLGERARMSTAAQRRETGEKEGTVNVHLVHTSEGV